MIVEIIFVLLAAIFKAAADTLVHHFDSSIFYKPGSRFWDINQSNKFPWYFPFTKYKIDAWHLCNSAMIGCFIGAACFYHRQSQFWIDFGVASVLFIVCFNFFYNKIFKR